MKKALLKSKLPDNTITKSAYLAVRLHDKFNIKTKTAKEHQQGIKYYVECPQENCNENYVRETNRRLSEWLIDHNGWDKSSHTFKHSVERGHRFPSLQEFTILGGNYRKNKVIENRSTFNTQEKSIPLKLCN